MSFKSKTNEVILKQYKKNGKDFTIELCYKLLETQNHVAASKGGEGMGIVLGEICETVLEILVIDYIRKNNLKDWFYEKGLIVKDIETMSQKFMTELDLVVFSPQKIYIFECKSYKGTKIIVGKGDMKRVGKPGMDVYSQNKLHSQVLIKIFNAFRDKSYGASVAYQPAVFSFAEGTLEDKREPEWKKLMPFLEVDDIENLFDLGRKGPSVWNMPKVRKAVSLIVERSKANNYVDKHLDYVTGLRSGKSERSDS